MASGDGGSTEQTRGERFELPAVLHLESSAAHAATLAARFARAKPFPHLVLRELLAIPPDAARHFPDASWRHWIPLTDGYQTGKATCSELHVIPQPWRALIEELSAARFLRFLETVTGIPKLLPDPHLEGGGLHLSGSGGHLRPHTDFHLYERLGLYRRVNVLVYLNPDWQPEHGGRLSLHEEDDLERSTLIDPTWGTCVIFATTDSSVHGITPVASTATRRSIALYYYTSEDTAEYGGDRSTHWRAHGDLGGLERLRLLAYHACMRLSRAFSMLGHLVNPHFGLRALREGLAERARSKKSPVEPPRP